MGVQSIRLDESCVCNAVYARIPSHDSAHGHVLNGWMPVVGTKLLKCVTNKSSPPPLTLSLPLLPSLLSFVANISIPLLIFSPPPPSLSPLSAFICGKYINPLLSLLSPPPLPISSPPPPLSLSSHCFSLPPLFLSLSPSVCLSLSLSLSLSPHPLQCAHPLSHSTPSSHSTTTTSANPPFPSPIASPPPPTHPPTHTHTHFNLKQDTAFS